MQTEWIRQRWKLDSGPHCGPQWAAEVEAAGMYLRALGQRIENARGL